MPKPKEGESQKDFVNRCVPIVMDEGTAKDNKQASAICYSMYRESKKKKESKEFMKNCKVRGLEIKEEGEGEFHVVGLIASTHIDGINDYIPKVTLDSWANAINSGIPTANKASYHHDREDRKVVGRAEETAKVISLPDGEYGLMVDTHVNRTWPGFDSLIYEIDNGFIDGFSVEYWTNEGATTHQEFRDGRTIRVLGPDTELHGYGFASRPVQAEAIITDFGFKELMLKTNKEGLLMAKKNIEEKEEKQEEENKEEDSTEVSESKDTEASKSESEAAPAKEAETLEEKELKKEFAEFKRAKKDTEFKERVLNIIKGVEVKEKVLQKPAKQAPGKSVPIEFKEYNDAILGKKEISVKEQFRRAGKVVDRLNLLDKPTSRAESREYKEFMVNGRHFEYKGLGLTTNVTDEYVDDTSGMGISAAELNDVFDPIIYNALNQKTVTWNVLAKEDFSSKGNNYVQFKLKTAANATAAFYADDAVSTGAVTRKKFMTKFKKLQVGVYVSGDMIAAARGGPIGDVFAQEVEDSTMDMLAVLNAALYAEKGAETDTEILGFEYITDSAGNTTLYGLTRSSTNKLTPDSATDTYINQSSTIISMTNLRAAIRQATTEGAERRNLVFFTSPTQGDMYRNKWDDSMRYEPRDTIFGFSTDMFVDGVPVFEDSDCNTDDWFLVDLDSHKVAIFVPPTIEMLGKTSDAESAFIKMYLATYNTRPRAMVQIYGCATS